MFRHRNFMKYDHNFHLMILSSYLHYKLGSTYCGFEWFWKILAHILAGSCFGHFRYGIQTQGAISIKNTFEHFQIFRVLDFRQNWKLEVFHPKIGLSSKMLFCLHTFTLCRVWWNRSLSSKMHRTFLQNARVFRP